MRSLEKVEVTMVISVEKILQRRDVDAALYLLSRMLSVEPGEKRGEVQALYDHLHNRSRIDDYERKQVVDLYREVVG